MTKMNTQALLLSAVTLCALGLTACGTANKSTTAVPTPQGTIALDVVKVGMPESTFKDAILTFVPDTSPNATMGGRSQYLSRTKDASGGQYVVQCVGGQCKTIMVNHMNQAIGKDAALKTLQSLFPSDATPTPKEDDSQLKSATPIIAVTFGDNYKGQLICADKAGSQVKLIVATNEQAAQ